MTDVVDRATRSRMMSGIRGKNTKPEMLVRQYLHAHGFRYRLHDKRLPGTPDLVLPKYQAVIFVHGCFWHRHAGCRYAYSPSSNVEFWSDKLGGNIERDRRQREELARAGWRVLVVWECGLKRKADLAGTLEAIRRWLLSTSRFAEIPKANAVDRHASRQKVATARNGAVAGAR